MQTTSISNRKEKYMASRRDPELQATVDAFAKLRIGASIFIKDATRADVEFLREPLTKLGIGVRIMRVECDLKHECPGVRIWRKRGAYDEL